MSIATTNESAPGDVVSSETALACLFRLGAQNGVYAEIGAVRRRNLIEGDSLPVARLVELAGEFGLRAERVRLDWEGLRNTPFSHPILLLLDNKNAVVLVGVRRNGPEEVADLRPGVPGRRAVLPGEGGSGARLARCGTGDHPAAADQGRRGIWLLVVHDQAVCRAPSDARYRRRGIGDAPDRIVGADLLSAARRQGGAEPGVLDTLCAERRGRGADPVRRRLQLSAQLSARLHHAPPRSPGRQQHDRASAAPADRLFPCQPVRGHRLQIAGGEQRQGFPGEPVVQHVPRFSRGHHLSAGAAALFVAADPDRARRLGDCLYRPRGDVAHLP